MKRMRFIVLSLLVGLTALAQNIINPSRLTPGLRNLESRWDEKPLECSVTPIKPALSFSLRIQGGFVVRVPMNQFEGTGHGWVILTRITPNGGNREPVYLAARTRLPDVPKNHSEIEIGGGYLLGEGKYDVRWMMLDDQGRACHKEWTIDAKLTSSERRAQVTMAPYTVAAFSLRGSLSSGGRIQDDAAPLRITILMHAAPLSPRRTRMRATDQMLLVGSLSALLERLPTSAVRIVVFNLDKQKELYRRDHFTPDEIQQVAQALNSLELNLIDYQTLLNRQGHIDLLSDLVNREVRAEQPSDAVVILGPVTRFLDKPASRALERPPGDLPRFFFFQYRPWAPQTASLPDSITRTISSLKGKVLTIRTPGDFAKAIEQLEKRAAGN